MFSTEDSIVAIATPPGRGGIGVVRISGASSLRIASAILDRREPLRPRYATYARVGRNGAGTLDEVIATYFPEPHSYTGEHVVEISAHGSPVVLRGILDRATAAGARLAEPGEFTLRAFLNGKRDLVQAEAVADLIDAATPLQARVAFDQLEGTLTARIGELDRQLFDLIARLEASLDFPDEGYHFVEPAEIGQRIACVVQALDRLLAGARSGRLIREGATVVVAGRPNVGKSSIFNGLVGVDRAIVTEVAGTTRDLIAERVDVHGLAITLVDTAGCREASDAVEREGVLRAARAREVAEVLLIVLDGSEPLTGEDERLLASTAGQRRVVVVNKSDLPQISGANISAAVEGHGGPFLAGPPPHTLARWGAVARPMSVHVSARTGSGLEKLREAIVEALTAGELLRDSALISNARHIALLEQARARLLAARASSMAGDTPEEIVLTDLQAARACFDEVVGTRTSEDVLRHIFERFCIGK